MSQVTIKLTDDTQQVFNPDDSRNSVVVDFCKATKADDYAGTWGDAERSNLDKLSPTTARVELESGKKYLLSPMRLTALTDYLTAVGGAAWNRTWGTDEQALFAGFSDAVAKDGT